MNFDRVREIVRDFDRKSFDGKLAAESGVAIFSSRYPVLLRNNDVTVEVSHDGFYGVTGVSVYGNTTYLDGVGSGEVIDEMKRVTSKGPVVYFSSGRSSTQEGFVFRQDSEPLNSGISACISNIRRLQNHMLEVVARYIPVSARVSVGSMARKRYVMHTENDGFHGRRDDHYKMAVEFEGEHTTVEGLISRFGNEKDGRCGSKTGKSWREVAGIINNLTGFNLSLETIRERFYKNRRAKLKSVQVVDW